MASPETQFPGTTADGDTGYQFNNAGNLTADDTSYATCSDVGSPYTAFNEVKLTNWGFAIPASATIDGIIVTCGAYDVWNDGTYDAEAQLSWDGGTSKTTAKSILSSSNFGSSPVSEFTCGGAADDWSRTWSDTEINSNTNFACFFRVSPDNYNNEITIDYVKVTVYYTEAGGAFPYHSVKQQRKDMKTLLTM